MLTQAALFAQTYTITTNVTPPGAGTVTGGGNNFHYEDEATLTATPNQHYTFNQWQDGNTDNPRNITVTGNATYTANFSINQYTITTNVTPEGAGTVTGGGTYNYNAHIVLTATPNPGYSFLRWNDNSQQNPRQITVTGNDTYTATFSQETYLITTNVSPQGAGSVTGGGAFHYGDTPTLTATANSGYEFLNWNDGNTQNPRQITVTGNATYTAHFAQEAPVEYTITVQAEPEDGGSVEGDGTYAQGTTATLRAIPNEHYTFEKWQDDNTQNPRQITVTGDATYTAYFTTKIYTINTKVEPLGAGRVEGGGEYHYGEQIELTANAFDGYTFSHWQDGDTLNPRQMIIVTGDTTYTAYFTTKIYTINVTADPEEGGTVDSGGDYQYGDYCTVTATENEHFVFIGWKENDELVSGEMTYRFQVEGDRNLVAKFASEDACIIYVDIVPEDAGTVTGAGVYTPGDPCTLKAMAKPGFTFDKWVNGYNVTISIEPTYEFTVTEDVTFTANFTPIQQSTITVTADPAEGGLVTGGGNYAMGLICHLNATPNEGYRFVNWTEDDMTQCVTEQYSFTVNSNRSLVAHFAAVNTFIISAMAGANSDITPRGDIIVAQGAEQTFSITPDAGCRINKVLVDGIDVGSVGSYTFTNVNRDHTIYVSFNGVGVDEAQIPSIDVYPNPAKDKVQIEGEGLETVSLFDMFGNCLYRIDAKSETKFDVSGLSRGIYILMLTTKDGHIAYQKLVLH